MRSGPEPRLLLSPPHMSGDETAFIGEAVASNWVAPLGPMVDAFEREFEAATAIPHALAVSSGTAALHLALRCLGLQAGDAIIAPSLTFIASVAPAIYLGAEPIFADVSDSSWTLDPQLFEEAVCVLRREGRRIGAVVPTDLYGQSCDLDLIIGIAAEHDIPVLADCAESLGARYKNRHAGSGAAAAAFSFNGNKIITTGGGGMLASPDAELIRHARQLSQQAREPAIHYEHRTVGYNYRLSNILAAVGRAQLRVLQRRVARRRAICRAYRRLLGDVPGISMMPEASYGRTTRWLTVITIDPGRFGTDRETVRLHLERKGIESRPVWKPMHLQPVFSGSRYFGRGVSDRLFHTGLCLPSGSQMTHCDVLRVSTAILECAQPSQKVGNSL